MHGDGPTHFRTPFWTCSRLAVILPAMHNPPEDLKLALQVAGLRATAQRLTVLGVLRAAHGHLSVETVTGQVRERLGSISQQAVYDVLGALAAGGLARRIEPAGSPALFESRVADNHHHLVCRGCGVVHDVDCALGAAPCIDLVSSQSHGFLLDEAEITFWGLCPSCQKSSV